MGFVLSTILVGFSYLMVLYTIPLRLQVVNGMSPLKAGVSLLPLLGVTAIGASIAGAANSTKNRTFEVLLAGTLLMTIGTAALSTLKNQVQVQPAVYGFQVLVGLGVGMTITTASLGALLESEMKDSSE